MLANNFRSGFRHLMRHPLNSSLHVIGLTFGMSVCLLIGLFLRNELSFDADHPNADRIYRVNSVWTESGKQFDLYASPIPLSEAIRHETSGVEKVTLTRAQFKTVVEIDPQKRFKQEHVLVVEPDFLDIFEIRVLRGDGHKALRIPYQALLTETTARKFFGDKDPMGKVFKYKNKFSITVAGIIRDLPAHTSLPASMLLSYVPEEEFLGNGDTWYFGDMAWTKLEASTYILVNENNDPGNLQVQLNRIADKNINSAPSLDKSIRGNFEIQALRDIHFDTKRFGGGPWVAAVDPQWLWFFAGIGLIVLILACINFLNLSTSEAFVRAREVGIRKSVGARRSQLILQFLSEACILTVISGVFSMMITQLALHSLNSVLNKSITFNPLQSPEIIIGIVLFIGLTSLLAGLYPAWIISRFNPVLALRSGSGGTGAHGSTWLRKGLVVTQFTISAGLFMAVLLIAQQVNFMRNNDLGFEKENILNIETGDPKKTQAFSNDVKQIRGVIDISFARSSPISDDHWWNTISQTETSDRQSVCAIYGDDHFYNVYGLKLLSGRIPQPTIRTDSVERQIPKVVVNEKLLEALDLGSPQEAVGKIFWWGSDTEIAGVVADFNTEPLKYAITPTLIAQDPEVYSHASIRLEPGPNFSGTLALIEASWKKHFPDGVYEFKFLDSQIDAFYKTETRLYTMFRIFAGLAMLISCLGLWGLVTFTSQRKTKEIAIRKTLGASVNAILLLLSKEFLLMICIAFAISVPLTYYFMKSWLQNFAFRIDIGWETFVTTGVSLIALAMITMSIQTIKAAWMNPVKNLKAE